ncbi:MAG: aminotransferase class V-fold PLP-dependent enzyme [Crenarchaeota archaeon]|nr:MAG: aminotransferase class V-fold PLP-dependent enzyme [Thermoproteota archaeon]RDJ34468.1 MAG: aminotransferase class V-fold PLP-dependent enzyme [Thermoproteota archaeon]RDJ34805.1 MAG: aminotransferase class V-fold PLP-dependent enzyme [Thermoproteota archaeon]RDJ38593.1 MAG: aminotransferase class V-fold PLP-dependent enzyme [Thermoproteota archaeon]
MNMNSDFSNDFPTGGKIYLNNASVSINPLDCINSMHDFLVSYNALGPDSLESQPFVTNQLRDTRKIISQIIKCQPEEIIFTQSTTDGVNAVANGMNFQPSSNLIIRGLSHEHHANYYPWLRLSKKLEIKNLKVDNNGFFQINELKHLIDNNTSLVALSHALYNTGTILPVEEVGEILDKQNIPYFLDTAQTIGCIGDFDVSKTKCNFMSFNGSKWLCGPMGTGLFYCRKDSAQLLEPMNIGGESVMIYDETKLAFKDIPDRFQTGFRNYVGMAGLEASAKYLIGFGMENIRKKVMNLANQLRTELSKIPNVTLYGPNETEQRTSIVSFNIKNQEPSLIVEKLEKKNIILAVREISEEKLIRASPHFFNSEEQIEILLNELRKL